MAKKSQRPVIQPLENYNTATDDEIVSLATAVAKGMTGNAKFPAPTADPAVLKTEVATFSALISDAPPKVFNPSINMESAVMVIRPASPGD